MKKKIMGIIAVAAIAAVVGYNVHASHNNVKLSDLALANVEALAGNESSATTHTLECGASGVKMCEATCGRCNVTLKAWGNGKTATLTCSL